MMPQEKFARGGWLASCDTIVTWSTDDYYGPRYIEQMVNALDGNLLVSHDAWYVYNIVDRMYGYQTDVMGGHSAYRKEILTTYNPPRDKFDGMREKHIPGIHGDPDIASEKLAGIDYMTIRHTPAGEYKDGWRRTIRDPAEGGHSCKKEATYIPDGDWMFFNERIPDLKIREFYQEYASGVEHQPKC
jgi:hypothetical protein